MRSTQTKYHTNVTRTSCIAVFHRRLDRYLRSTQTKYDTLEKHTDQVQYKRHTHVLPALQSSIDALITTIQSDPKLSGILEEELKLVRQSSAALVSALERRGVCIVMCFKELNLVNLFYSLCLPHAKISRLAWLANTIYKYLYAHTYNI